jgi:hypothetical protein
MTLMTPIIDTRGLALKLMYYPFTNQSCVICPVLTYSMEHSPLEANRFSASQEIPRILWNPKIHYHIYKSLPPVHILSQMDPIHGPPSHLLKNHFNIIRPSSAHNFSRFVTDLLNVLCPKQKAQHYQYIGPSLAVHYLHYSASQRLIWISLILHIFRAFEHRVILRATSTVALY